MPRIFMTIRGQAGPISTWHNPDGLIDQMSYDILRRSHDGRQQSALAYVTAKTRANGRPMCDRAIIGDVSGNEVLLPHWAPDLFANPDFLWKEVDAQAWTYNQDLLAGPTFWFPGNTPRHLSMRQVRAFAQTRIVDRYGVAAHLIAHDPGRIGRRGDFHVHLLCTARVVNSDGFGAFVRPLLQKGAHQQLKADWDCWRGSQAAA